MDSLAEKKLALLRQSVVDRRVTQGEIAAATGVDQSQVSRILAGPVKRFSENVQKLCAFADTMAHPPKEKLDGEASLLLAEILAGNPKIKVAAIELLRNMLALRRQYENAAGK